MTDKRQEERKKKQMQSKIFPKQWADIRKLRSVLKSRNYNQKLQSDRKIFSSSPRCIIQSCVHGREWTATFAAFQRKVFSPCSLLVSTHTNSAELSFSLELRLWCQQQRELQEVVTLSAAAFPRQRRQTGGSAAPRWTPGASTTSAANACCLLFAFATIYSANIFRMFKHHHHKPTTRRKRWN